MCGIAGIIASQPIARLSQIGQAMTEHLRHRGPNTQLVWTSPDSKALLAHTRLAIQDLDARSSQPMWSADRRIALIFNGEIYNFQTLRNELLHAGCAFRTTSDTEVLLQAIEHWGMEAAVKKLRGMFAFAVWDVSTSTLSLCRDRFGIKPCYWMWEDGVLTFASEIKAILASVDHPLSLDLYTVESVLNHSYSQSPGTIFREVRQLEAGEILRLPAGGEPTTATYWSLSEEIEERRNRTGSAGEEHLERAFSDIWSSVIQDYLTADVPVGCFLSGGVDSSMIAAAAVRFAPNGIKTFSVGYEERQWDESENARAVANYLGTEHHELILSDSDVLGLIESLPDIYDEPFADFSQVPTLALSRFARQHVTVCLSGDGGDELFAGYDRYRWAGSLWERLSRHSLQQRQAMMHIVDTVPLHDLDKVLRTAINGLACPSTSQYNLQAPALPFSEYYRRIMTNGSAELLDDTVIPKPRANGRFDPITLQSRLHEMQASDIRYYMGDGILTKVDRASMSVGLEVRIPLLDERIFEFAFNLPDDLKVSGGGLRVFQRNFTEGQFPPGFFDRPKRGFGFPVDKWLRTSLRDWAEALLQPHTLRDVPLLRVSRVRELWESHQRGTRDEHWKLWPVLMYVQWFNRWNAPLREKAAT